MSNNSNICVILVLATPHHSLFLKAFAVLILVSYTHGLMEGRGGGWGRRCPQDLKHGFKEFLFQLLLSRIFPPPLNWDGMRLWLFAIWEQWAGRLATHLHSCLFADVYLVQGLHGQLGSTPQVNRALHANLQGHDI